jgi:hypothetical protein
VGGGGAERRSGGEEGRGEGRE